MGGTARFRPPCTTSQRGTAGAEPPCYRILYRGGRCGRHGPSWGQRAACSACTRCCAQGDRAAGRGLGGNRAVAARCLGRHTGRSGAGRGAGPPAIRVGGAVLRRTGTSPSDERRHAGNGRGCRGGNHDGACPEHDDRGGRRGSDRYADRGDQGGGNEHTKGVSRVVEHERPHAAAFLILAPPSVKPRVGCHGWPRGGTRPAYRCSGAKNSVGIGGGVAASPAGRAASGGGSGGREGAGGGRRRRAAPAGLWHASLRPSRSFGGASNAVNRTPRGIACAGPGCGATAAWLGPRARIGRLDTAMLET